MKEGNKTYEKNVNKITEKKRNPDRNAKVTELNN